MQLNEIYKIADELAPKAISDEACQKYGYYDNSGILVDTGEDVKGILFSLDLSDGAIDKAVEVGANLIITHHPAIYGGIGERLTQDTPLGRKLSLCIKNGISIIAMHLNLDFAKDGIDECLMNGIAYPFNKKTGAGTSLIASMHVLPNGSYGRAYAIDETLLQTLAQHISKEFESDKTIFYGDKDKKIRRIASFCGAGADEEAIDFAKKNQADVIISSDFKHHVLALAQEMDLAVIIMTHYASENYGFKKYSKKISQRVSIPCVEYTDQNLL